MCEEARVRSVLKKGAWLYDRNTYAYSQFGCFSSFKLDRLGFDSQVRVIHREFLSITI